MRDFLNNLQPHVSGGLIALLSLAATAIVGLYTDIQGILQIPKELLVQVLGCIGSIFLGMLVYSFTLSNKINKKEERKLRIAKWRDDLNNFNCVRDFYKTSTYHELEAQLTKEDKNIKSSIEKHGRAIVLVVDGYGTRIDDSVSRLKNLYLKVIIRLKNQWGLF